MEEKNLDIFETGLDETAKAYLLETVRWTKFLAILSIILSAITILGALLSMVFASQFSSGSAIGLSLFYLATAAIYIYPTYALYKFSTLLKRGINNGGQDLINEGFRQQKNMFRFIGIMLIVVFVFVLLAIIFGGVSAIFPMNR